MTAHIAIYAGSFDPITTGHLDVVKRARGMFDKVILGIGQNPDKQSLLACEKRVSLATTLVEELVSEAPDLAPVEVTPYEGLTVDFAKASGAAALIRGIRNVTDLAAETQLAITNRQVADIETVFIVTGEMYAFTSSSLIRQIAALGGDLDRLSNLIPPLVIETLQTMQSEEGGPLQSLIQENHMD
ncbi:MAG: pantetheine-phosphate adenylyltransferase [Planctomycetota bacterium]|nr:pantetheine-phosphate adenylyltransferase [Planctomycetota bacterium]